MTQTCLGRKESPFYPAPTTKRKQQFFDKHHNTMMLWTCMIITWSII